MTQEVLIITAHPKKEKSRVNMTLVTVLKQAKQFLVHDLYDTYPDFYINVKHEQKLLKHAKLIVLVYPLYWYSTPALIKEWIDSVWGQGWAYGETGNQLKGKHFLNVISTDGTQKSYQKNGLHHATIEDFLLPIRQSAHVCQMHWLEPMVLYGSNLCNEEQITQHAYTVRDRLLHFVENELARVRD